jgi:hypothetical protein
MRTARKPIHRNGYRNALCPDYSKCLDLAVRRSWEFWDCGECKYRSERDPEFDMEVTLNRSVVYYDVPLEVAVKM